MSPDSLTAENRDLRSMADALFTAAIDREATRSGDFDADLWEELHAVGLADLTAPASVGGSDATWRQAALVLDSAARHGIQVPVAEHDLLAGWLLRTIGDPDGSSRTDTFGLSNDGASCVLPWADVAETAVILREQNGEWHYARLRLHSDDAPPAVAFGGVTWSRLSELEAVNWKPVGSPGVADAVIRRGAAVRSIQVAGAMDGMNSLTVEHAMMRRQFGQPLRKFQAVQRLLADVAAHSALAGTAVARLVDALEQDAVTDADVAVAKSCVGRSAEVLVRASHQVHGAIGTTQEHRLHRFSGAIYAWSRDFGGAATWERKLAEHLSGPEAAQDLWRLVTGV
ncbi:acyl-CoA dehydrogenase family protein [Actinomadura alba]|uniref:Acyl-CoA/acyl-ACP dehydrogenase n=1 Tax=Actinomadura alba TaxID=406431 RepID=A0ABR7LTJ3_9ACTN|nr:acyl-CoA dehydrogenase family protein [Actinomadura alba]MBC6468090.1 acyl-CoA/acyl-ACP dehydrogenase [Actinomadura alba]